MRWPWVSRELYERACTERDAARLAGQQYSAYWAEGADRYCVLLEKYAALVTPQPQPGSLASYVQPIADVKPEPSLVAQTIKEEADGDPKLARWLRKRASDLRREGKSDGDIVSELQKWETTEPEMGVLG